MTLEIRALLEAKAREFVVVGKVSLKVLTMGLKEEKLNKSSRIKSNLQGIWPFLVCNSESLFMKPTQMVGTKLSIIRMMIVIEIWQIYIFVKIIKIRIGLQLMGLEEEIIACRLLWKILSKYIFILHSIPPKSHGCLEW